MQAAPGRIIRGAGAGLILALVAACARPDAEVPWDTAEMVRTLTAELRRFEGVRSDLIDPEVLGWHITQSIGGLRVEQALIWARIGTRNEPGWALVQGFRHPGGENVWRRSLFTRYLRAPLTDPRPGEDVNGTWHAFQRYSAPPTVREICEFAAVDFLQLPAVPADWSRLGGELRTNAWRRVVDAEPGCHFN